MSVFLKMAAVLAALLPLAAGAADEVLAAPEGPARAAGPGGPPANVARELGWDNGTWKYLVRWHTGLDSWVANDFAWRAGSTPRVLNIKLFSSTVWPNDRWDGFRVALYGFGGSPPKPGAMLWPTSGTGYFFQPLAGTGHIWVEVPINWVVPSPRFVAAMEQGSNPPNCDPFAVDNNPTFRGHSWMSHAGQPWQHLETTSDPYLNLMLRVTVDVGNTGPAVAPASLGRVKALYY